MLKHAFRLLEILCFVPAAFRRLCVETNLSPDDVVSVTPAAFRRLCVETETTVIERRTQQAQPPSGGCVLKQNSNGSCIGTIGPAAFRRLCVET